MKSGLYGLWVVPKNRIIFLLNNSLLPLLPGVRLLLSKKFDFLGLPTRPYRPDFILEHLYQLMVIENYYNDDICVFHQPPLLANVVYE